MVKEDEVCHLKKKIMVSSNEQPTTSQHYKDMCASHANVVLDSNK